jgi:cold shock protein
MDERLLAVRASRNPRAPHQLAHLFALSPISTRRPATRRSDCQRAKVKWFDSSKGYGFIVPDDGGKDVFVHMRDVEKAGYTTLVEGVRVAYDLRELKGRVQANNLRIS